MHDGEPQDGKICRPIRSNPEDYCDYESEVNDDVSDEDGFSNQDGFSDEDDLSDEDDISDEDEDISDEVDGFSDEDDLSDEDYDMVGRPALNTSDKITY